MLFDEYASKYRETVNRASGVSVEKLAAEKARLVADVIERSVGALGKSKVLDVGCGIGLVDRELETLVQSVCGVDTSQSSLDVARKMAEATQFIHYSGYVLPFADDSFDATFASCVLHHIPLHERRVFLAEMLRVLRPGGAVLIIEHNPLNPVTRRIVASCEFDADAILLWPRETKRLLSSTGAKDIKLRYTGFSPIRNRTIEQGEKYIGWMPIGAQYCAWAIKSNSLR